MTTPDFRPAIRKALCARPSVRWLLREIFSAPGFPSRDSVNRRRRELVATLVCSLWPQINGGEEQAVRVIGMRGVELGLWGSGSDPRQTILRIARECGYIPPQRQEAA